MFRQRSTWFTCLVLLLPVVVGVLVALLTPSHRVVNGVVCGLVILAIGLYGTHSLRGHDSRRK